MPRHTAVVRHAAAGRLVPARLFVRFRTPRKGVREDPSGTPGILAEGPLVPGAQEIGPLRVRVSVDVGDDAALYEIEARSVAAAPVQVDAAGLGFRWEGPPSAGLRFLRQGWQSWSFAGGWPLDEAGEPAFPSGPWLRGFHRALGASPADRAGWHEADLVTVVGASPAGVAAAAGVLETGRALGVVFLRREADGVALEAEQWVERPLDPGESLRLEAVRVALGADAHALLDQHARAHGERAGARSGTAMPTAWCTWYHFFHDVDEARFLRNLEALAACRGDLPIDVVQLDDGYQRAIGDWLETNEKFPRGLAAVAGDVVDAGFVPGLWLAPFCVVPESRLFARHRDWLLKRDGEPLRGLHHAIWTRDGWVYVLDPSREAVRTWLRRLGAAVVALGFPYLKLDFLYTAGLEAEAFDPRMPRAARLRAGLEALREGAGDDAFLLGCGCPLGPAVGVVDAMRIGPDTAPHWAPDPAQAIPGLEPTLPSARNAVRNTLARSWMHRRLWINDPDCLLARGTETRLTADEVRTLAATIAATGGLAVLSDDLPALTPERRALVAETLRLARGVDLASHDGAPRVLGLLEDEVARGALGALADGALVALVNAGDDPAVREADLAEPAPMAEGASLVPVLGSPPPDVWKEGRIAVEIPAHGSAAYRLARGPRLAVFCDFDGTFAVQDVGSTLARRYAGDRRPALWERLTRGELSAWQYNMELLDGLPVPEAELEDFLRTVELDPGARELVDWCEAHGVPFRVLSDGFDRNLDRLQELHGVRFDYDANRLRYEGDRWRIEASHPNPACTCGTGTCKRSRIEAFRREHPDTLVVHVGNGRVSDLCGAEAADVVFAKDSLAEALAERGIPFHRFETLREVRAELERLLASRAGARPGAAPPA